MALSADRLSCTFSLQLVHGIPEIASLLFRSCMIFALTQLLVVSAAVHGPVTVALTCQEAILSVAESADKYFPALIEYFYGIQGLTDHIPADYLLTEYRESHHRAVLRLVSICSPLLPSTDTSREFLQASEDRKACFEVESITLAALHGARQLEVARNLLEDYSEAMSNLQQIEGRILVNSVGLVTESLNDSGDTRLSSKNLASLLISLGSQRLLTQVAALSRECLPCRTCTVRLVS